MKRVRRWTRFGGLLLCVGVLGCQEDDDLLSIPTVERVEIRDEPRDGREAGSSDGDGQPGHDAGSSPNRIAERDGEQRDGGSADARKDDPDDRRDDAWRPSDAQIMKLLAVANKAEIDQANAALPKLRDSSVRAFAGHVVEAHGAAQARQTLLSQSLGSAPIASVASSNAEYESAGILARLQAASAEEIDRFYIDSQVTAHNKVLDTLERTLIPSAQAPGVQSELRSAFAEAQAHLDEAWALGERARANR